jgi:hypothetical protein
VLFGKKKFVQPVGIPNYGVAPSYDGSGAGNFVFEQEFTNPVYLARGAGRVAGALRVTQRPQSWFNYRAAEIGIGGTIAGQMILQPLVDNNGGNNS